MADYHTMLVNASMALDDIEKIEFKSELMNDPVKSQQYASERQNKQADETLQIKRGNFQKAFYDMGRYMDMDHHARYYEVRNGDLNRAQNNIVSIAEANTSSLKFDMDNTKRQFLVNEWYAQNKLESLFFLQVAFLAMVSSMIVIMLGKMNLFPWIFGKYVVFIIASAAAILALYRFNYTRYTRDVRYWNKRKFSDNPGTLKAGDLCKSAEAAAAGLGQMSGNIMSGNFGMPSMGGGMMAGSPGGPPPGGPPS
jgi:hypothetical protein